MSEETKKDKQKESAEEIELSNQDLEQVAGGGTNTNTLTAKDKIIKYMSGT